MNSKISLKPKQKIYVIVLTFIIFIVLMTYLIIIPSLKKIKKTRVDILNQKIELKQSMDQSKNLNQLKEKINNIEPELKKLDKIFINKNRELDFITSLEAIAEQYNIEQNINLNPGKNEEKGYKSSPITINLEGNYLDILQYLRTIESSQYYININSINLGLSSSNNNSQLKNNEDIKVSMIIGADIYWKNN